MSRKPLQWPRFHIYERRLNRLLFMLYSSSPGSEKSGIAFLNPLTAGQSNIAIPDQAADRLAMSTCLPRGRAALLLASELSGHYG